MRAYLFFTRSVLDQGFERGCPDDILDFCGSCGDLSCDRLVEIGDVFVDHGLVLDVVDGCGKESNVGWRREKKKKGQLLAAI